MTTEKIKATKIRRGRKRYTVSMVRHLSDELTPYRDNFEIVTFTDYLNKQGQRVSSTSSNISLYGTYREAMKAFNDRVRYYRKK